MSEERSRAYLAPIPYPLCDAIFASFFDVYTMNNVQARRKTITAGSAVYVITAETFTIGTIYLRQSINDCTYLIIRPAIVKNTTAQLDILEMMLGAFWSYYEHRADQDKKARPLQTLPITDQIATRLADLAPPRIKATDPREPQRGDSVDRWLDWRETRQKQGKRMTLKDIAKQSGHSISTISKHSAWRKRRSPK